MAGDTRQSSTPSAPAPQASDHNAAHAPPGTTPSSAQPPPRRRFAGYLYDPKAPPSAEKLAEDAEMPTVKNLPPLPPLNEAKQQRAREIVNTMPGGTANTAGGEKIQALGLSDGLRSIKWNDWTELPKYPCVREALMTGIGVGVAFWGGGLIFRQTLWKAGNWGFGGFVFSAFSSHEYCKWTYRKEKEGISQAIQIVDQKQAERRRKMEEVMRRRKEAEERKKEEERLKEEEARRRRWWKFW